MSKLNEQGLAVLVEEINRSVNTKINEALLPPTEYITREEFNRVISEINNIISSMK